MKRVKYNWFHIIDELNMRLAFEQYKCANINFHLQNNTKCISDKRLARAFCLHFRSLLPKDLSWAIKGAEKSIGVSYVM